MTERDYAGMPLAAVTVDTDPLPDNLTEWVETGKVNGQPKAMFNPYDDSYFAPTGDTVQAWQRRRVLLQNKRASAASPEEILELQGMNAVSSLQGITMRLRKSLEDAGGSQQDWKNALLKLAESLKEEADSRGWCDEYDTLMGEFAATLPGTVRYEFEQTAVRNVTVRIIRRRRFEVWVQDYVIDSEVLATDADSIDAYDYFDDDALPSRVEEFFESEDVDAYMDTCDVEFTVDVLYD